MVKRAIIVGSIGAGVGLFRRALRRADNNAKGGAPPGRGSSRVGMRETRRE